MITETLKNLLIKKGAENQNPILILYVQFVSESGGINVSIPGKKILWSSTQL